MHGLPGGILKKNDASIIAFCYFMNSNYSDAVMPTTWACAQYGESVV
jgi:hypothetical protein